MCDRDGSSAGASISLGAVYRGQGRHVDQCRSARRAMLWFRTRQTTGVQQITGGVGWCIGRKNASACVMTRAGSSPAGRDFRAESGIAKTTTPAGHNSYCAACALQCCYETRRSLRRVGGAHSPTHDAATLGASLYGSTHDHDRGSIITLTRTAKAMQRLEAVWRPRAPRSRAAAMLFPLGTSATCNRICY